MGFNKTPMIIHFRSALENAAFLATKSLLFSFVTDSSHPDALEFLVRAAHALAFSRLQFSIFLIGLSDVQTWTSGQGEVLYRDVTFRRSGIEDD